MERKKTVSRVQGIVARRVEISIPEKAFLRLNNWVGGEEELRHDFIISAIWGRLARLSDLEDPIGWEKRERWERWEKQEVKGSGRETGDSIKP